MPIVITMSSAAAASAARSASCEAAGRGDAVEQLLGAGLAPRHPAGADRVEHRAVVVDAQYAHSAIGERQRKREADPAQADHRD